MKVEIRAGLITFVILVGIILFVSLITLFPVFMGNVILWAASIFAACFGVTYIYKCILSGLRGE